MKKFAEKFGKNATYSPECPFCGKPVERPRELETRRPGEMPVGTCSNCKAVYSYDVSGHNQGSAFIEALVFGCNMDWDLAWNLLPGEDYLESLLENYDIESNLIVPGGFYEGRKVPGVLYFIRLNEEIQDATYIGVQKKIESAARPLTGGSREAFSRKYSKHDIEEAVANYNVDLIQNAAGQDKKVMRILQRLLCSDSLTRLRAADMLGRASAVIAKKEPGSVSVMLHNLINSMADTGSSSWGSLDAIGEIIGNCPDVFIGYMPTLFHFLNDTDSRPQVIKSLARISEARPDLVRKTIFRLLPYLDDPVPEARGYTTILLGNIGAPEAVPELEKLLTDRQIAGIYRNGEIVKVTVGELATEALEKIK